MPRSDSQRENQKDKHPRWEKKPTNVGWWLFGLFILVGAAALIWTALIYRDEAFPPWVSFLSTNLLNFLLICVVLIQAYIYHQQRVIMGIAVNPRLRVANVRAADFGVGGLPVFIVTMVNEGATPARNVEIKSYLQKGDDPPVYWTRQQSVTIPANGKEDYPIRWPSILRREDIDGFNDNVTLYVYGIFRNETETRIFFCYKYYPWPFWKRPDGLPQFVPCTFDPGLSITMKAEAGGFATVMGEGEAVRGGAVTENNKDNDEEPN